MSGWYGVDLDGTLAEYDGQSAGAIGKPILKMVKRVKAALADGAEIRIFTARAYSVPDDATRQRAAAIAVLAIQSWCDENLGAVLPITCQKDFDMIELWDDR